MERRDAEKAAGAWLERLGLADRAADKLETLSKGNQQKIQLAAAILHRPHFALLDEPFSGLDPLNQQLLLDLLRELCDEGMTVLLSAHQMELIERVADRVLLIGHGREVLSGPPKDATRPRCGSSSEAASWAESSSSGAWTRPSWWSPKSRAGTSSRPR